MIMDLKTLQIWNLYFNYHIKFPQPPRDNSFKSVEKITSTLNENRGDFISSAHQNISNGLYELSDIGSGGVYFIKDNLGKPFAVFKPQDEEPGSPSCPRKVPKNNSPPILDPGKGYLREIAAYKLDKSFAGVPETYLITDAVMKAFPKPFGSIQRFVENDGYCGEVSNSFFSTEDIHRIGILDIRIFNMDRNEENILIKKTETGSYKLVPIDHTYSIPPWGKISKGAWFDWLTWKQAKQPFSQQSLDYIQSIDVEEDVQTLRNLGFDEESVRTLICCTVLLKECSKMGMTLFEIGSKVTRTFGSTEPSFMECWVNKVLGMIETSTNPVDNMTLLKALQTYPPSLGKFK